MMFQCWVTSVVYSIVNFTVEMTSLRIFSVVCLVVASLGTVYPQLVGSAENDARLRELYTRSDQIKEWVQTRVFGKAKSPKAELEIDCDTCHLGISLAFSFLEQGDMEEVGNALIGLCQDLQIVADDVCKGIVELEFPHIHYIFTNRNLSVTDVCGMLLQNQGCGDVNEEMTNWTINVNETKPAFVEMPALPDGTPTVQVLHLTDIHPDLHYAEGSLTDCGKPMCCRVGDTWDEPWNETVEAGRWGDYACDIPIHALQELFSNSAGQYDYKFVMVGGDYVHHAVWNTTMEDNKDHYQAVADAVFAAFPSTPVYPTVGNHEPHPVNLFPPTSVWDQFDNSWVYENLADNFGTHLPADAQETFRKAGYYSVNLEPNFRLVVLNTNLCYLLNFWIMYEPVDPEGQLQWFADTMQKAEDAGEKVFILGHVPPGSEECWSVWSTQFSRVVDRYEAIIMAQFYGHTHFDDFAVFFSEDRPSNAYYVGASATAYTDLNPGYKVFHVDAAEGGQDTWEIVDHETWIYNLPQANVDDAPTWVKLYSAKEDYGLKSLRPGDLYQFIINMAEDEALFQKFYNHYHKDADTILPCTDEKECRRDYLCAALTANDADKTHCADIDDIIPRPSSTTPPALSNYR